MSRSRARRNRKRYSTSEWKRLRAIAQIKHCTHLYKAGKMDAQGILLHLNKGSWVISHPRKNGLKAKLKAMKLDSLEFLELAIGNKESPTSYHQKEIFKTLAGSKDFNFGRMPNHGRGFSLSNMVVEDIY